MENEKTHNSIQQQKKQLDCWQRCFLCKKQQGNKDDSAADLVTATEKTEAMQRPTPGAELDQRVAREDLLKVGCFDLLNHVGNLAAAARPQREINEVHNWRTPV